MLRMKETYFKITPLKKQKRKEKEKQNRKYM